MAARKSCGCNTDSCGRRQAADWRQCAANRPASGTRAAAMRKASHRHLIFSSLAIAGERCLAQAPRRCGGRASHWLPCIAPVLRLHAQRSEFKGQAGKLNQIQLAPPAGHGETSGAAGWQALPLHLYSGASCRTPCSTTVICQHLKGQLCPTAQLAGCR